MVSFEEGEAQQWQRTMRQATAKKIVSDLTLAIEAGDCEAIEFAISNCVINPPKPEELQPLDMLIKFRRWWRGL